MLDLPCFAIDHYGQIFTESTRIVIPDCLGITKSLQYRV